MKAMKTESMDVAIQILVPIIVIALGCVFLFSGKHDNEIFGAFLVGLGFGKGLFGCDK